MTGQSAHDFSFRAIDGQPLPLSGYAGKTVLVVNTASQCGFTPQYGDLEHLHETYAKKGLVVLGIPCNQFGGQEPDSEGEIAQFCETSFGVKFPMASKEEVLGDEAHPFYLWARGQLGDEQAPKWNFHKYLVGPDGDLVAAIPSPTRPTDPEVISVIEANLPA